VLIASALIIYKMSSLITAGIRTMAANEKKPGVSAILIARNEEKCIRECLESIKTADEIIVVDGMSTDRTREICAEYTDLIYTRQPTGHPEPDREFGCGVASYSWLLFIDADESLCPELSADLHKIISDEFDGYSIPRWNYMKPGYRAHCYFIDHAFRLARYDMIVHQTKLHTPIDVKGRTTTLPDDKYYLIHTPPARNFRQTLRHYLKWANVHAVEMSATRRYPRPVYLIYAPVRFIKELYYNYVQKGGYMDGWFGVEWAMLWAIYWSYVCIVVGLGLESITHKQPAQTHAGASQ
jgi:glycosyltransferase involved in cell wall biosynthesis